MSQIDDLVRSILGGSRPRAKARTPIQFARTVTLADGPLKGTRYSPESDPVQHWLLRQLSSGKWHRVFVAAPAQAGKTLVAVLVPALQALVEHRDPVGYALPTGSDLNRLWSAKLKPMIVGSGYGDHLPVSGPGSRGGRADVVAFRDPVTGDHEGDLIFLTGGAYSVTVRYVIVDELDQFRCANGEPQWSELGDLFARTDAFGAKSIRIGAGTVENDCDSIPLTLVAEGTDTRVWQKCPVCGRHQAVTWEQVSYDGDNEESVKDSARIACKHCGALWTEADRQEAIAYAEFAHKGQEVDESGSVVGPSPRTKTLGLLWTSLDSCLRDLGDLAYRHWTAQKEIDENANHELMRKFYRYSLVRCYTGDQDDVGAGAQISPVFLEQRSSDSDYQDGEVHPESEFIVSAVDVQQNRVYWEVRGANFEGSSWVASYGVEEACAYGSEATVEALHAALDRVHAIVLAHSEEYGAPFVAGGIDVGFRQDDLIPWIDRHAEWKPVKGTTDKRRGSKMGQQSARGRLDHHGAYYIRRQIPGHWDLFLVDSLPMRGEVHDRLLRPAGTQGAINLPYGIPRTKSFLRHLCAYARVKDIKTGAIKWQKGKGREDFLDVAGYIQALVLWVIDTYGHKSSLPSPSPEDDPAPTQARSPAPSWITDSF